MPAGKSHTINLEALPADVRRTVWKWLQENDPDYAASLQQLKDDPFFQQLKSEFDGSVVYELAGELPESLRCIPDNAITTHRYRERRSA